MSAYIKAISYYLPVSVLDNEELNRQFPEWSVDKIATKTGIYNRHIAAEGEFASDMALKAANNLFEEHNIDRSTVDFILLCTQSPDYFLPTTACILQYQLQLPTQCGALDFNLGCSGYIYGLALAKGLIEASIAKNVLLITSETYSKHIHPRDKSNRTIFGDAAAATLITKATGFAEILNFDLGSDGSGAGNLIVKYGGMRYLKEAADSKDFQDEYGNIMNDRNLHMNGGEIFNFTLQRVPPMIDSVLKKNNLSIEQIDLVIPHQANKYMLNHLRKKLQIDESKFYYFLDCANTVSSTIPLALNSAMNTDKIAANQHLLLAGFGVGYSWGACVIKT